MTYEFNETIGIGICLCSRVGGEWEFTDFVCDTGSFELFFILTDPCDLYRNFGLSELGLKKERERNEKESCTNRDVCRQPKG